MVPEAFGKDAHIHIASDEYKAGLQLVCSRASTSPQSVN